MPPAIAPTTESPSDATDLTAGPTAPASSWYDPDASAWEPQPAAQFEALRASPVRPPVVVDTRPGEEA